jgi:general secretion pathway protein I
MWCSDMQRRQIYFRSSIKTGFTLLEVLVALVIVATALGASLRAIGSLTQNDEAVRKSMLASWTAENHLVQIRLQSTWPALGTRSFPCPQANLKLTCSEQVDATPNVHFRRVEVRVYDGTTSGQRLASLAHVVGDAH